MEYQQGSRVYQHAAEGDRIGDSPASGHLSAAKHITLAQDSHGDSSIINLSSSREVSAPTLASQVAQPSAALGYKLEMDANSKRVTPPMPSSPSPAKRARVESNSDVDGPGLNGGDSTLPTQFASTHPASQSSHLKRARSSNDMRAANESPRVDYQPPRIDSSQGLARTSQSPSLLPALRQLPPPILLLIQSHLQAVTLTTPFPVAQSRASTPRQSPSQSDPSYGSRWNEWQRRSGALIATLRAVVAASGESAGAQNGRLELRARCQLAEILIRQMEGVTEAEAVIAKGLSIAQGHVAFEDYKYRLYYLQAELAMVQTNVKFAKTILKRAIAEIQSSPTLLFPAWLYHYHLFLASIMAEDADYPGALASLRQVEELAEQRGDDELKWVSRVLLVRLTLGERELKTAGVIIEQVSEMMALSGVEGQVDQGYLGRQIRIQFLFMYALYHAQQGQNVWAKDKLKTAHALLDSKDTEVGEAEGWTAITIHPPRLSNASPIASTSQLATSTTIVKLALAPHALIYNFGFLTSCAVHRDPYGARPRSKIFANVGLEFLQKKLDGTESWLPPRLASTDLPELMTTVAKMKVALLILSAENDTLRSDFPSAAALLADAIATARGHVGLFEHFQQRITLAHGTLAQARGQDERALKCFQVVIRLPKNKRENDLVALAQMSILMIKIAQGHKVRIIDEVGSSAIKRQGGSTGAGELWSLNRLARDLVANISGEAPALRTVAEIIQALTRGEITKAKAHLAQALKISNAVAASHSKALILALLANLFLHTRNDQALKMLKAAHKILVSMGTRDEAAAKELMVGNARLGLWVGEKLLESYQRDEPAKVQEQLVSNDAQRRALARLT